MKKIVSICVVIITFHAAVFTQCGVNYKELLDKCCNGVYLQHQELDNGSNGKITFMFKRDNRYAIYLINPSRLLPEFALSGSKTSTLKDVVSEVNKKEKTLTYIFTAGETGEYDFSYKFKTKEDACVLMAIYLQNFTLFQPGVYSNFEEMKYNNPSAPVDHKINSNVVKLNGSQKVTYYKPDIKGSQSNEPGKVFGFSDGKTLYIKRTGDGGSGNEFVKIDNYGNYGYFEDIASGVKNSDANAYLILNLVDMNSGSITRIDSKHLTEIMADDPKLLEAFNHESQKDKKLKEYLIHYLSDRNDSKSEVILPFKVTRTMSYARYSITKVGNIDYNIKFRFYRAGIEMFLGPVFTCSSGEAYHYGSITGIQNPTFPIDIKVQFRAPHYFAPISSYEVAFEFTINEPGTWDVVISY